MKANYSHSRQGASWGSSSSSQASCRAFSEDACTFAFACTGAWRSDVRFGFNYSTGNTKLIRNHEDLIVMILVKDKMVQNFVPSRQCGLGLRPSATPACAFCFVLVFGGRLPRVDKSSSGVLVVEDEGVLDALERRLRRGEEA